MKLAKAVLLPLVLMAALSTSASALTVVAEHVTGGNLDLTWMAGFNTPNNMYAKTLDAIDPAYANPSGDHTVAVAQNASPDSGGIIVAATDPGGIGSDYSWEAQVFMGDGNTRRGLIVRADPTNNFSSFYMMVIESGLFQIRFRKLVNGVPTTLASWFTTVLPAGSVAVNTWHKMKVVAHGNLLHCYFDDFELTTPPIADGDLPSGWVGVYNFRFDLGNVPVYYDDLTLDSDYATPAKHETWGALKQRFR